MIFKLYFISRSLFSKPVRGNITVKVGVDLDPSYLDSTFHSSNSLKFVETLAPTEHSLQMVFIEDK